MENGPQATEYITQELLEYEPCLADMFVTIKSGDYQRLIWSEPQDLRSREEDAWDSFQDYISDNSLAELPKYYSDYERIGLRFLQGCKWKNEAAYKEIFEHWEWR